MLREGTLDDIPRAAPMRQRAWPESIVTIALTDNDETNAPMLAVNARLGYQPLARRLRWERTLAEAATSSP